jgi:hypothetical protein
LLVATSKIDWWVRAVVLKWSSVEQNPQSAREGLATAQSKNRSRVRQRRRRATIYEEIRLICAQLLCEVPFETLFAVGIENFLSGRYFVLPSPSPPPLGSLLNPLSANNLVILHIISMILLN